MAAICFGQQIPAKERLINCMRGESTMRRRTTVIVTVVVAGAALAAALIVVRM